MNTGVRAQVLLSFLSKSYDCLKDTTASLLLPNYDKIITYTVIKITAFVFTMSIWTYSIVAIGLVINIFERKHITEQRQNEALSKHTFVRPENSSP